MKLLPSVSRSVVLPAVTLAVFLLLWELIVRAFGIDENLLPSPSTCFFSLIDSSVYGVSSSSFNDRPTIMALIHLFSSVGRVALALIVVAIVSVPIAMFLEAVSFVRLALTPLFAALASVTPAVWIVLAIRMPFLESEFAAPAFVIMAASLFLTSLSIRQEFHRVPKSLLNLGQRLGAVGWKRWVHIVFPYAAPGLLHIFRAQFLFGLAIAPFVEVSGAQYGIGQLMYLAKQFSNVSLALGLIGLLATTGFAVDFIFRKIEAKSFQWAVSR